MKEYDEIDLFEDNRKEYEEKIRAPYYTAKKTNLVDEIDQRKFKKDTYAYYIKQKNALDDIGDVDSPRRKKVERHIKALDHGWSPEDLPFLDSVHDMYDYIKEKEGYIPEHISAECDACIKEIDNGYIDKPIDRRRLIDISRSIGNAYAQTHQNKAQEIRDQRQTALKNKVEIVHVDSDYRDRVETINFFSDQLDGLNTQHRVSVRNHRDTDEMDRLKKKVIDLIRTFGGNRDKSIYDDEKYMKLYEEVEGLADAYIVAKQAEAKRKFYAERDEEIAKRTAEIDRQIEEAEATFTDPKKLEKFKYDKAVEKNHIRNEINNKAEQKLKVWRPNTKMGKTRYESALAIKAEAGRRKLALQELRTKRSDMSDEEKNLEADGYTVIRRADAKYMARRPYEENLNQITNYYGKNPMFIFEHCKRKRTPGMYSLDEYKTVLKPVEVDGVTNEEFATVAYASVLDLKNIDEKELMRTSECNLPENTKEDIFLKRRTMFTLDIGMDSPRYDMAKHFLKWTMVPAKEKAKEAIEAYNSGDKTKLADILATGMKETNNDASMLDSISRHSGGINFALASGMLEKMVTFAKKDPELYSMIGKKLGKDKMLEISDTLRLKKYLDDCCDAERKLQKAVEDGKPLSKTEKQKCINAIIRFEYVSAIHDKQRKAQIEDDPDVQHFRDSKNYEKMVMEGMQKGYGKNDIAVMEDKIRNKAVRPVHLVTKHLRTKNGQAALKESVQKAVKGIDAGQDEKTILKNVKKCSDGLHKAAENMRKRELARREAFDKARAKYEEAAKKNDKGTEVKVHP